jgi:hypothetical protein
MIDPKGEQAFMSSPIRASKLQLVDFSALPKNVFGEKPSKYSRITGDNVINFSELTSQLEVENARVSFWAADQFGSGTYTDSVSGKKYDLDRRISFPLDKKGRRNCKKYCRNRCGQSHATFCHLFRSRRGSNLR